MEAVVVVVVVDAVDGGVDEVVAGVDVVDAGVDVVDAGVDVVDAAEKNKWNIPLHIRHIKPLLSYARG